MSYYLLQLFKLYQALKEKLNWNVSVKFMSSEDNHDKLRSIMNFDFYLMVVMRSQNPPQHADNNFENKAFI